MKIISDYPPNFDKIKAAFPGATKEGIIFAYYPDIYKPHGKPELRRDLRAHEQVHLDRQIEWPCGAEQWWDNYISSVFFRYEEEKLAHIAEARSMAEQAPVLNRPERRRIAAWIGGRLAAPLYSAGTSKKEATKLIMASLIS